MMDPMWIYLYLAISGVVFYYGFQAGSASSENHFKLASLASCPTLSPKPDPIVQNIALDSSSSSSSSTTTTNTNTNEPCDGAPLATCPTYPKIDLYKLHRAKATAPEDLFPHLKHPSTPAKWSWYISRDVDWGTNKEAKVLESKCQHMYLTRTGSFANQPNKCVAVALVPPGTESIVQQSHRVGYTALKTNQYQEDYPREYGAKNGKPDSEALLLAPFLAEFDALKGVFIKKMGDPIDPATGQRKHAIVMVANTGVMDLLLNFLCSAEEIKLDLSSIIVFVGDEASLQLIENMGANAIYSPALGSMPTHAAKVYLDDTFGRIMWFKTTSVYLALSCGFNVLFQDVDLVWLKDPFPYLLGLDQDLVFMDDGQISPRYTPYYVNSGFYFVRYNSRTSYLFEKMMKGGASEIGKSHSHQQVLIRHISETHHLFGVSIYVLERKLFPSGQTYHENKKLIKKIQDREFRPYVFHMCWTDNRENKIVYFKDVGLWYLPEKQEECKTGTALLDYLQSHRTTSIRDHCCQRDRYWPPESLNSSSIKG